MQQSDIARFRQEQILQEQSAQQALYGFTSVANHASINARMQRGAEYLLTLLDAGKYEEVAHLMETTAWALEDATGHMTTNENTYNERGNREREWHGRQP